MSLLSYQERLLTNLTRLSDEPKQSYFNRLTERVAELVAKQIAAQIAPEIPRIVESVSKAAAVEAVAVARDMPKATADAIIHVLTLGRV